MTRSLDHKTALVTGASKGIGLAVAQRFAAEGARVLLTGRERTAIEAAAASCEGAARGVVADASSLADIEGVAREIEALGAPLDILVVNAGSGDFRPLGAIDEAHFDRIFDLNVKGMTFLVQRAVPLMRDGGSIVLLSSVTAYSGTPALSIYSASKAAVRALARSWILDLRERRIRVNVVSPGPTETPGLAALAPDAQTGAEMKAFLEQTIPLGRLGRAEEIASAVLFMASNASSFVNGADLAVDGGAAQI